jgi:NitT/TauT family transport system substrate-binding protein
MVNQTRKKALVAIGLVIILVLTLLPGCQEKETEVVHLKVVALPYLSFATFYIPQEEGYFAEQGLEVEFVKFNSVVQAMPLLAQGDLDVAAGPMSASLINAIVQGTTLRIVAGREYMTASSLSGSLMVRKDLYDSGQIDTIAEVKGHKVALSAIGTLQHFELSRILESAGLTLADVEVTKLSPQDIITAFANKAIEVALLGDPHNGQAESLGYAVGLPYDSELLGSFQQGFVIFGPNLLGKNPEAGRKFIIAYLKGVRQWMEGTTERNLEIMEKYTELDRETLLNSDWNPIYTDGRIKTEDILTFQDWLYDNEFIEKKLTEDQLIDTRFIDYANQVLGPPE